MLLLSSSADAQDPLFSQFVKSKMYLNPGYTGAEGGFSATIVEREQWGKVLSNAPLPGSFRTQYLALEWNTPKNKNSLGLQFLNDTEGEGRLRTILTGFNYSYVISFGGAVNHQNDLRLGFGLYYAQKWIRDWDELLFSDQLHPKGPDYFLESSAHAQFYEQFQQNPPWWTGLNLGAVYSFYENQGGTGGKRFDIGLSTTHVINLWSSAEIESLQNIGTSLSPRLTFHVTGYSPTWRFGAKGNKWTPLPALRIERQGNVNAFTIGSDFWINSISFGGYYHRTLANTFLKSTDAVIITSALGLLMGDDHFMEIGFSYDFNLSGLSNSNSGNVFELTLNYSKKTFTNKVVCPPISRLHAEKYERSFYKNQKNKNLN
ncbi:MAG: PorP/SprF family type IX secretion system membrane protein [Saprospiraceae bacterium]|nr:PorP/SprF family type IX secretion system membrane protein [Saprospiraceae bacterium]